jgi:hypothetical protein
VPERARLVVHFDLPTTVSHAVQRALAVRVLDAVRGARRTYGTVHVSVHGPAAAHAPTTPLSSSTPGAHPYGVTRSGASRR